MANERQLHPIAQTLARELFKQSSLLGLSEASFQKWRKLLARQPKRREICTHLMVLAGRFAEQKADAIVAQIRELVMQTLGKREAQSVVDQTAAATTEARRLVDPGLGSRPQPTRGLAPPAPALMRRSSTSSGRTQPEPCRVQALINGLADLPRQND